MAQQERTGEGITQRSRSSGKSMAQRDYAGLLERINDRYPFEGKRVFELGGHNINRELALGELKARKWIASDYIRGASGAGDTALTPELLGELVIPVDNAHLIEKLSHIDYAVIDGDFTCLKGFTNAFDLSISINVFQHSENCRAHCPPLNAFLYPEDITLPYGRLFGHVGRHIECDL